MMKKRKATVSVILSTYNRPDFLVKVLDGYLIQTVKPDEIIIGDDGSDDKTAEVISEYKEKADFPIHHIWQEHKGFRLAKIRNKAVRASSSMYLIFSDGDCVPHKCFIEDHIKVMQPGCIIQGKRMSVSKKATSDFKSISLIKCIPLCLSGNLSHPHHLIRIPGFTIKNNSYKNIKTLNFALYRKDFDAVNGLNEDFTGWGREDNELVVRLLKFGLKRKDVPFSAIVFHLWHQLCSQEQLERNQKLLEESIKSPEYRCNNGINKQCNRQSQKLK
jgi:glycosyltransferase involved in cell wall biosynthesis